MVAAPATHLVYIFSLSIFVVRPPLASARKGGRREMRTYITENMVIMIGLSL